ncbi:MAG: type II secretion system minor pseudopilin GspI [Gammaproteobacteria bacterium]|nr:type II secretion system minor pseudopilin GspI [Gammaproteobacteria bacterium]
MNTQRGFTLLEVLVALAIIAYALAALIRVTGTGVANASYLRDRTFAHWVAENHLAEMRTRDGFWPATGKDDGDVEMAGRQWFWTTRVTSTPESQMRRIDVEVRLDDDEEVSPISILTGFVARPQRGDAPGLTPPTAPGSSGGGTGDGE